MHGGIVAGTPRHHATGYSYTAESYAPGAQLWSGPTGHLLPALMRPLMPARRAARTSGGAPVLQSVLLPAGTQAKPGPQKITLGTETIDLIQLGVFRLPPAAPDAGADHELEMHELTATVKSAGCDELIFSVDGGTFARV